MPKEMITMRLSRASGQPWGFVIVGGKDQVSLLLYLEPGITRNNLKSLKPFFFPFFCKDVQLKKTFPKVILTIKVKEWRERDHEM